MLAAQAPRRDEAQRILGGRYQLEELIGRGGMGEVWRALDLRLGKRVAVKVLSRGLIKDSAAMARFSAEAKRTAPIQHPNVVGILDDGADDDWHPFYVMELLEGRTLGDVILDDGRLPPARAIKIVRQILGALSCAHRYVVHRDLKPNNVMLVRIGEDPDFVKVLDFGIARALDQAGAGLTDESRPPGTPEYMAPEVVAGPAEVHPRNDIYAAGVILYRLLVQDSPWGQRTATEVFAAVAARAQPKSLREVDRTLPADLERVVARAMAFDPAERFQSAEEFRAALFALENPSVEALPEGLVIDETYKIEAKIGQGGIAAVYRAFDVRMKRLCALKILLEPSDALGVEEMRQRFFLEGHLEDSLSYHPSIVRAFAQGEWHKHAYLVLEYVEGLPLRKRLETGMSWKELLAVLEEIAGTLDAVHKKGIVHRDLSPENILVETSGKVRLLDFGIAHAPSSELTRSSNEYDVFGRIGYLSPEQAVRPGDVSPRSDEWSLAAMVYEAVTGRVPFWEPGESKEIARQEIPRRLRGSEPPISPSALNPSVTKALDAAILRALELEPKDRFASVKEFVTALGKAGGGGVTLQYGKESAAPLATAAEKRSAKKNRKRGGRLYWVATPVLVAVAAGGVWLWRSQSRLPTGRTSFGESSPITQALPPPVPKEAPKVPPKPPPKPPDQTITLKGKPVDAIAIIDGKRTPLPATVTRPAGTRLGILVEREGYKSEETEVVFAEGRQEQLVELVAEKASGRKTRKRTGGEKEYRRDFIHWDDRKTGGTSPRTASPESRDR